MKKSIYVLFIIAVVLASSCSSVKTFSINRIRHVEPNIASASIDSFTILGEVSGSGTVNSNFQSQKEKKFVGDTGLYGTLDWADAIYLDLPKDSMPAPATPFDAALGNAIYNMIEEADKLKADVILFVRTKTQVQEKKGVQEVSVTVRGVAAKLK